MSETSTVTTPEENPVEASAPESLDDLEPKMKLTGIVKRLELYGAFIDIGVGVNALIHISHLGQERVNRVSDVISVGDEVSVYVEKVDPQRKQVMVSMIEPLDVEWRDLEPGQVYTGTISRLENFGAFVDIGAEKEGLVHISELSHDFVRHPGEVLTVGKEVNVKVLGYSKRKRRIDLSIKALLDAPAPEEPTQIENGQSRRRKKARPRKEESSYVEVEMDEEDMPTAMEIAMRKAMGDDLPSRSRSSRRQRRRSKIRAQQDDIMSRTLHLQEDN
jgi:ribosomal protein S1